MAEAASSPGQRTLVVAFVEDHPKAMLLLRAARKHAQEIPDGKGVWRAVFVETPQHSRQAEDGVHERLLRLLTLAAQMGGQTEHFEAPSMEKGVEQVLLREEGRLVTIVLGSMETIGRLSRLRASPWMRAVRLAGGRAQVEIVPLSGQIPHPHFLDQLIARGLRPIELLYALTVLGIACICGLALQSALPPSMFPITTQNIALVFMIACAFAAGRLGLMAGMVASLGSFLILNYYFTPPYHAIKMHSVTDVLNMLLFLSAALLISLFASQTHRYAERTARRELSTQALFTLYRIASEAFSRPQAIEKLQRKLERMLEMDVAFFLPPLLNPDGIEAAYPSSLPLSDADRQALETCWSDMKTTGAASPYNPGTAWRFEPMVSGGGEIGVLGVRPRPRRRGSRTQLDAWFGRLLTAIADQTASVLERIELERSMESSRIREEREKLRSMLLSSVSHDLKTPLAGIIGALSVHISLGDRLAAGKRAELIESSLEEAQRLDSFITNILDMTRLETGSVSFKPQWYSVQSMLGHAIRRLQPRLRKRTVVVQPFPPGLELWVDNAMTMQAFQNVLDNACKYTPEGTRIEINITAEPDTGFVCEVRDFGPGLPPEKLAYVFDKYARIQKQDSQVAGTGLGLSIARAVMEEQGGSITAANHPEGGAMFTLYLPTWRLAEGKPQLPAANPAKTGTGI